MSGVPPGSVPAAPLAQRGGHGKPFQHFHEFVLRMAVIRSIQPV
jgi:hypothetical protein